MPEAHYAIGDTFPAQFAWRLPDGDYLRAVFTCEVLSLVPAAVKYVVRLTQLLAGRQETSEGVLKPEDTFNSDYWPLVQKLAGRRISLAFEADDTHAVHLRLETLTGAHNFFYRFPD